MAADRACVLGYYPSWDSDMPPSRIDYRLFTHLAHAFAKVDADTGAVTAPDLAASRDLCRRAQAAGVKTLLSVGGAESGPDLSRATAAVGAADRVADRLVAAVRAAGYDGVDVDWEFPLDPAAQARMVALVRALRQRLPQGTLTMAVPATDWNGRWFETGSLASLVDFVNVMTYDFHGPWTDHAGHNAPVDYSPLDGHAACRPITIQASMAYWLQQKRWPKEKLVLGIPLYGRGFRAPRLGAAASGEYARSYVAYRDVTALQKAGWKRTWDTAAEAPFLQNSDGTEVLSYDDDTSVRRKAGLARRLGVAGVFFWEITQDYDGRSNPLVRAARAALIG